MFFYFLNSKYFFNILASLCCYTFCSSFLSVKNVVFENETSSNCGGSFYNDACYLTITNSTFVNCFSSNSGGAFYNDGFYFSLKKKMLLK